MFGAEWGFQNCEEQGSDQRQHLLPLEVVPPIAGGDGFVHLNSERSALSLNKTPGNSEILQLVLYPVDSGGWGSAVVQYKDHHFSHFSLCFK